MRVKIIEIRDVATMITALCVDMNPDNDVHRWYLRRCGYPCSGRPNIGITHLSANGTPFQNDPYAWDGRTWPVAHHHIIEHWDELEDGSVVDVEVVLGEKETPKVSERFDP